MFSFSMNMCAKSLFKKKVYINQLNCNCYSIFFFIYFILKVVSTSYSERELKYKVPTYIKFFVIFLYLLFFRIPKLSSVKVIRKRRYSFQCDFLEYLYFYIFFLFFFSGKTVAFVLMYRVTIMLFFGEINTNLKLCLFYSSLSVILKKM